MWFFQAEELKTPEVFQGNTSEFIFSGRRFIKSVSFSKRLREAAIGFCEQEIRDGIHCLLVEGVSEFTIWKHKPETATELWMNQGHGWHRELVS